MIIAGFGFRRNAEVASFQTALAAAVDAAGIPVPTAFATAIDKAGFAAFCAFAEASGLVIHAVSLEHIAAQTGAALGSRAPARYGNRSLAEAAALAAAGPGARLLARRRVSPDGRATCAIAKGGMP